MVYLGASQTPMIELFAKIVKGKLCSNNNMIVKLAKTFFSKMLHQTCLKGDKIFEFFRQRYYKGFKPMQYFSFKRKLYLLIYLIN